MYDIEKHSTILKKCSTVLENVAGFARLDAALGYVYTLGKQLHVPLNSVRVKMAPALSF